MTTIMAVFGTRPEAIKMAPVVKALQKHRDVTTVVCVTAQHRGLLDGVLETFGIFPDIDLDIMKDGQDLFDITSQVLMEMNKILSIHRPDAVLVHGDTTTSFATALACFYVGVPIAHVEAGLRTWDLSSPFPEEFNRKSVGTLAKWHFAPTEIARANLREEGISDTDIYVTGNTIVDSLNFLLAKLELEEDSRLQLENELECRLGFDYRSKKFILITAHRRENLGAGLQSIFAALCELASEYPDLYFVFPVHPNPQVRLTAEKSLTGFPNIRLVEPLDYDQFLLLLRECFLVVTDSGGVQEEAPILGKPVLLIREITERPEGVNAGAVKIVGADERIIINSVNDLLSDDILYKAMAGNRYLLGDGNAADRIVSILIKELAE